MNRSRRWLILATMAMAVMLVLLMEAVVAQEPARLQEHGIPSPQQASTWPPPYRVAMFEDLSTINYWAYLGPQSTVWNGYVLGQLVHSLFTLSDQRYDFIPRLAADFGSAPVLQGGLWLIEVPLRQGILWSDGHEFTAEDVVFTLQTCVDLDLGQNWPNQCPDALDHVEATGPYTVTYYFVEEPGLGLWQSGVAMAPVLPKHYWEPIVEYAKTQADPAGYLYIHHSWHEPTLGPFRLDKWVPGSQVEIVPNPHYYFQGLQVTEYANGAYQETLPGVYTFIAYGDPTGAVDLGFTVGPHVGSVQYSIYSDQEAVFQALLDGDVDYVLNPLAVPEETRLSLEQDPDVTTALNQAYGMGYLAFNMRKPPMDVLAFRQAVATLMDRESFVNIAPGNIDPLWSVIPEGNVFWHNPATPRMGEGLTRQERISDTVDLLTTAGFTWTVEPSWDPVGQQVLPGEGLHYGGARVPEIELLSLNYDYDPIRATEALSIEQWLNEAGISVTAVLTDFSHIVGSVFGDVTFDTYILGWSLGSVAFPSHFESFWHSRNDTATTGNSNTPGYNNPVYDTLCDDFMTTSDLQQARDDAFQMQVILATDLPYVTLHTTRVFDAYLGERITFPYTETLSGLEHQSGMPDLVQFPPVEGEVDPEGGMLDVPLADTTFTFPAGTFSETVGVRYTVQQPSATGELVGAGPFFDLSAVYSDTGQPAEVEPGHSYTVEIHYGNTRSTVEDTMGLYWRDEGSGAWSQEGISSTVNALADMVIAQVDHFSLFALLGETNRVYLPLVLRNH
jgi:peptide/nickel transport system substrate-binding protein